MPSTRRSNSSPEYASGIAPSGALVAAYEGKLKAHDGVGSQKMVVLRRHEHEPVRVFDSGVTLPDRRHA